MAIRWRDQYSVKNAEIDRQHKRLFEIGGSLYDIVSARDELDHYDEILRIMEDLRSYTVYHFEFEEALMRQNGYPLLDAHKEEHATFIAELGRNTGADLDANQKETVLQLVMMVTDWITAHIMRTDMQYSDLLRDMAD